MVTPVEVFLTRAEYKQAIDVGVERSFKHRHEDGERLGTTYRTGRKLPDIAGEILACMAELAVAKFYETEWNSAPWDLNIHSDMKRAPDVEPNFEVRRINDRGGALSLRHDDERSKVAVLAYVDWENSQKVVLIGGILIADAMDLSVESSKAVQGDNYIHFTKDNNYVVMQDGLYDVRTFDPVLTQNR